MDGSAGPFVFLLQSAGIEEQRAPKRFFRIRRTVEVRDGDKSELWFDLDQAHVFDPSTGENLTRYAGAARAGAAQPRSARAESDIPAAPA